MYIALVSASQLISSNVAYKGGKHFPISRQNIRGKLLV
jgi:hypothetical protein